eukprot:5696685-Amphidinium_carterae.1
MAQGSTNYISKLLYLVYQEEIKQFYKLTLTVITQDAKLQGRVQQVQWYNLQELRFYFQQDTTNSGTIKCRSRTQRNWYKGEQCHLREEHAKLTLRQSTY